jgi:hypothetical protein
MLQPATRIAVGREVGGYRSGFEWPGIMHNQPGGYQETRRERNGYGLS